MSLLTPLLNDLRDRKVLALALALLAGVVAAPLLLSHSATPPKAQPLPSLATPVAADTGTPVTVKADAAQAKVAGHSRDPFSQPAPPKATTSSTSASLASAATAAIATTTAPGGVSVSSSHWSTLSSTPAPVTSTGAPATTPTQSSSTAPASSAPATPAAPAPAGLTPIQSYGVALSITQANGDLATIDPLQRDSELPSAAQPALVELGVLQGGKRVLFAVEPGVSVSGPGTCVPGPLDCQILALSVNETEGVQVGPNSQSLPFSVTGISVVNHPSVAAANLARRDRSAAGYALVQASARSAGSMFPYEASLGVVVDLRNLTVGGH